MIGARRYKRETDFETVSNWWVLHGEVPPIEALYPQTGFIVENVAAGFLYRTDSAMAMIEMIIYNPQARRDIRQKALDEVIEAIILEAKALDYSILTGITNKPTVLERSKKFGFSLIENNMVTHLLHQKYQFSCCLIFYSQI